MSLLFVANGHLQSDGTGLDNILFMTEDNRTYIAIDLKSFFASVECAERGLDPLTTNLVVANVRNIWNSSTGSYNGFYRRNNK